MVISAIFGLIFAAFLKANLHKNKNINEFIYTYTASKRGGIT